MSCYENKCKFLIISFVEIFLLKDLKHVTKILFLNAFLIFLF